MKVYYFVRQCITELTNPKALLGFHEIADLPYYCYYYYYFIPRGKGGGVHGHPRIPLATPLS